MSEHSPVLLMVCPVFAAVFCVLFGMRNKAVCLPLVLLGLGGSLYFAVDVFYQVQASSSKAISYYLAGWNGTDFPRGVGIEYRVDLLKSLVLMLIPAVGLLAALFSREFVPRETPGKEPQYYTLFLLLLTGLMGMTVTGDAFNLYVLLEVSSLTGYALIAMGSPRAAVSAFQYVILGTIGATFYLLGVGYLYIKTGSLNMAGIHHAIVAHGLMESPAIYVAFILIFAGIWVKLAFFPVFNWLPNAYSQAPTSTGCVVAPLMTKVSVYIMVRVMITLFGADYVYGSLDWSGPIVWVSVIAILSGSVLAFAQKDLRRMLTYLIVAEVGYMVGGAWLLVPGGMARGELLSQTATGMVGTTYHIISDAAMTLCLFMAAGAMIRKAGSSRISSMYGLFSKSPVTMVCFVVGALSMIGVPPTCGFFSKWYLVSGAFAAGRWEFAIALLISSLMNAVLFFRVIEHAFFMNPDDKGEENIAPAFSENPSSMLVPLVLAAASLFAIGLFNKEIAGYLEQFLFYAQFGSYG
jgi:multicomponent Na+:H+ antiporter subunit D